MKLIVYTLTPEGTIPNYIIDGGYLPWANNNITPQDFDLVGVATDDAPQDGFADEIALVAYAQEKGFIFENPNTKEVIPLETVVSTIWSKLG
jgi:hypothetical protein